LKWAAIGLSAGLLFGEVRRWAGPWYDSGQVDTLDAAGFERLVLERGDYAHDKQLRTYHAGEPAVRALVVHPPTDADPLATWVTGEQYAVVLRRTTPGDLRSPLVPYGGWSAFKFRSPMPFRAVLGGGGVYRSAADYLSAIQHNANPSLVYRSAWWERAPLDVLLPSALGLFGIGVLWPFGVRLITGGRGVDDGSPLPNDPRAVTATVPPPSGIAADASLRLAALNESLAASLSSAGGAALSRGEPSRVETPPDFAPTVPVAAEEPPAEATTEERSYGGEFYPVARRVKPDTATESGPIELPSGS
jgi:hypothetical protein